MSNEEYKTIMKDHGPFVSVCVAALLVGVCRQRMYQLVGSHRIDSFRLLGQVMVCSGSLWEWRASRKVGRPRGGRLNRA